jgi:hypothetical protein
VENNFFRSSAAAFKKQSPFSLTLKSVNKTCAISPRRISEIFLGASSRSSGGGFPVITFTLPLCNFRQTKARFDYWSRRTQIRGTSREEVGAIEDRRSLPTRNLSIGALYLSDFAVRCVGRVAAQTAHAHSRELAGRVSVEPLTFTRPRWHVDRNPDELQRSLDRFRVVRQAVGFTRVMHSYG